MAKGDRYFNTMKRFQNQREAEAAGQVADSKDVRMALLERFHAGELTLDQVKAEIASLKRGAKKRGLITRAQAFRL